MTRMGQFVLACVGFAALLIVFVHPMFHPPVSTPVKAQLAFMFLAIATLSLAILLQLTQTICRPVEVDDVFTPPEDERLALFCTRIC